MNAATYSFDDAMPEEPESSDESHSEDDEEEEEGEEEEEEEGVKILLVEIMNRYHIGIIHLLITLFCFSLEIGFHVSAVMREKL